MTPSEITAYIKLWVPEANSMQVARLRKLVEDTDRAAFERGIQVGHAAEAESRDRIKQLKEMK